MKRALFAAFFMVTACENAEAPQTVSPAELCQHLGEAGCPQGADQHCIENNSPAPDLANRCESERNELRRCYWIDLPANSDEELAVDPFSCVLSDACTNESESLCRCERGVECGTEE